MLRLHRTFCYGFTICRFCKRLPLGRSNSGLLGSMQIRSAAKGLHYFGLQLYNIVIQVVVRERRSLGRDPKQSSSTRYAGCAINNVIQNRIFFLLFSFSLVLQSLYTNNTLCNKRDWICFLPMGIHYIVGVTFYWAPTFSA